MAKETTEGDALDGIAAVVFAFVTLRRRRGNRDLRLKHHYCTLRRKTRLGHEFEQRAMLGGAFWRETVATPKGVGFSSDRPTPQPVAGISMRTLPLGCRFFYDQGQKSRVAAVYQKVETDSPSLRTAKRVRVSISMRTDKARTLPSPITN